MAKSVAKGVIKDTILHFVRLAIGVCLLISSLTSVFVKTILPIFFIVLGVWLFFTTVVPMLLVKIQYSKIPDMKKILSNILFVGMLISVVYIGMGIVSLILQDALIVLLIGYSVVQLLGFIYSKLFYNYLMQISKLSGKDLSLNLHWWDTALTIISLIFYLFAVALYFIGIDYNTLITIIGSYIIISAMLSYVSYCARTIIALKRKKDGIKDLNVEDTTL